ncbi:unnamed protein product, partial [Heterotrigona itama]
IISIQRYHTDEFKKNATNYCVRFGHSLWSANQLPAQEVKRPISVSTVNTSESTT